MATGLNGGIQLTNMKHSKKMKTSDIDLIKSSEKTLDLDQN